MITSQIEGIQYRWSHKYPAGRCLTDQVILRKCFVLLINSQWQEDRYGVEAPELFLLLIVNLTVLFQNISNVGQQGNTNWCLNGLILSFSWW